MGVEGGALGEVGVLEEVGGEGDEAGEGGLGALFGRIGDEFEAEELVGVGEVIGGEEDGCFLAGSGNCQLPTVMDAGWGKLTAR